MNKTAGLDPCWRYNEDGYVVGEVSEGHVRIRISQHRWVMEKHLGRKLLAGEEIHHKNHTRDDNRIENLEVVDSKAHASHHAKIRARRSGYKQKLSDQERSRRSDAIYKIKPWDFPHDTQKISERVSLSKPWLKSYRAGVWPKEIARLSAIQSPTLGQQAKLIRLRLGLPLWKVAKAAGIGKSTVCMIENGRFQHGQSLKLMMDYLTNQQTGEHNATLRSQQPMGEPPAR